MSIRMKLLLSYAAMLIVPVILFGLALLLLLAAFRGDLHDIREMYRLDGSKQALLGNLQDQDMRIFRELQRDAKSNPDQFARPADMADIEKEIEAAKAGLVILKNGQVIHASDWVNRPDILGKLTAGENGEREENATERINNRLYTAERVSFAFSDHSAGDLIYIREVNPLANFARKFFPLLFFLLLLILVLTHTLLTYLVSRSIIRPLGTLRAAALQIKEGNLDFQVVPHGNDEIGQLGSAFEAMRRQLKISVDTQLQYEENRKELISNISHDLKTPITAIKGYVEGIRDGVPDTPEKMDKYIRTIYAKAKDMDALIDELFLLSKLDLKSIPFHFEKVDLGDFLRDCREELMVELEKNGVSLRVEMDSLDGVSVMADREKLKRVITNVVENSIKYMDKPQKTIRLTAAATDRAVAVRIADNGRGVEPDALPFIFDRFYRADKSRSAATGGSGLGLAIAREIMAGHGGEIRAESEPGIGMTITFSMPRIPSSKGEAE